MLLRRAQKLLFFITRRAVPLLILIARVKKNEITRALFTLTSLRCCYALRGRRRAATLRRRLLFRDRAPARCCAR